MQSEKRLKILINDQQENTFQITTNVAFKEGFQNIRLI